MVQSTGLEPVTSSFAGRRSNPTELRLHWIVRALYRFFLEINRNLLFLEDFPYLSYIYEDLLLERFWIFKEFYFSDFFYESELEDSFLRK